jgi:hypothetical protein
LIVPVKDYRCHAWIQNNALALGASDGSIYILLEGSIIQELNFEPLLSVECIVPLAKGMVVGGQQGFIYFFDQLFPEIKRDGYEVGKKLQFPDTEAIIQTMVASSSQGELLIETNKSQIYKISLEPTDVTKKASFLLLVIHYFFNTEHRKKKLNLNLLLIVFIMVQSKAWIYVVENLY